MTRKSTLICSAILFLAVLFWIASNSMNQMPATNDDSILENARPIELATNSLTLSKQDINLIPMDGPLKQEVVDIKDPMFLDQLSTPYGFALDPIHQRLLWTSSGNETFMFANLDGKMPSAIQSSFEEPYPIKVETSFGYKLLFVADGALKLKEYDLQLQTNSEVVLLELDTQEVHGLGFDEALDTIYIGDQYGQPAFVIVLPYDDETIVVKSVTHLNSEFP